MRRDFAKSMVKTGSGRVHLIKSIQKRDGQIVPFDLAKITGAINKAMTIVPAPIKKPLAIAAKINAKMICE